MKFDGCYHGHSDGLLAGGGSGVAMLGLPGSVGVPDGAVADTAVVPYNVVPELDDEVACVIVEPVAANMNLVAPSPGFLAGLRAACDAVGALLIFDEVITGFRLGPGGATAWSGVTPDLWCFGKVIGGGLPVGAVGGRPGPAGVAGAGGAGVPGGHALGEPARHGRRTRRALRSDRRGLRRSRPAGARLRGESRSRPSHKGGSRWTYPLSARWSVSSWLRATEAQFQTPVDYVTARGSAANGVYPRFFHAMLRRGVALAPGAYEVMFPGLSHDADVLDRVVVAAGESAAEVAKEL